MAAAPEDTVENRVVETIDADVTSISEELSEEAPSASARSIYGYAAQYTNPLRGSFTVNAPGSGNSTGTFQITTHDFSGSPTINAVLYRPDGSYATQIYISGNGTKTATFSNAVAGTYEIVYAVGGTNAGWISAWVSS
ncbi:MAG: hypothetical protein J6A04_00600 [Clostridia bacterium]|nr:hypothetical protein [Clostridia bacterium]